VTVLPKTINLNWEMLIITNSSLITSINQNSKQVLNAKINVLLTIFANDMHRDIPRYQQNFIRLAYNFQNMTGKSWCRYDFPHMKDGYFNNMPTWNCKNCDMPMTLQENIVDVPCPHCGRKMVQVSDR